MHIPSKPLFHRTQKRLSVQQSSSNKSSGTFLATYCLDVCPSSSYQLLIDPSYGHWSGNLHQWLACLKQKAFWGYLTQNLSSWAASPEANRYQSLSLYQRHRRNLYQWRLYHLYWLNLYLLRRPCHPVSLASRLQTNRGQRFSFWPAVDTTMCASTGTLFDWLRPPPANANRPSLCPAVLMYRQKFVVFLRNLLCLRHRKSSPRHQTHLRPQNLEFQGHKGCWLSRDSFITMLRQCCGNPVSECQRAWRAMSK